MDGALHNLLESRQGADRAMLASMVAELVAAARSTWPTVDLATEQFIAYLGDRLPCGIEIETALRNLHVSDLYLACACAHGDTSALAAFELQCLTVVDRALARLGMDPDVVNEVKQRLRCALLVAETGPPRITRFAGHGALRSWVRVMAVHEAFTVTRQARRHAGDHDDDRLADVACVGATPEIDYFKHRYRREFEIAFRDAIRALGDRERTLLRQHFLDGVGVNELAKLYRVHRATATRWLEHARSQVLATTRAHLMDRLDLPPAEIENILRQILSRLEINMRLLFRRRA